MLTERFIKCLLGIAVFVGGGGLALQIVWNAKLREYTHSTLLTAILSLAVSILLLLLVWLSGIFARGHLPLTYETPVWSWFGGSFAAFFLLFSMLALPKLGASPVVILAVLGQIAAALVLDKTGAFGSPVVAVDRIRLLGILIIAVGVAITIYPRS